MLVRGGLAPGAWNNIVHRYWGFVVAGPEKFMGMMGDRTCFIDNGCSGRGQAKNSSSLTALKNLSKSDGKKL